MDFQQNMHVYLVFIFCGDKRYQVVIRRHNSIKTDNTMDKRYQGVIRRRKSMKDRKNNGQKIPRGNKKA